MPRLTISVNDHFDEVIRKAAEAANMSVSAYLVSAADRQLNQWKIGSSFDVEDGGYARTHFYTAGTDKRGHSERLVARVPPTVMGEVAHLVQSGLIPEYRTAADFVRDAIHHRLHDIETMITAEGWKPRASIERVLAQLRYREWKREAGVETAERVSAELNRLYAASDIMGVEVLVEDLMDQIAPLDPAEKAPVVQLLEQAKLWVNRIRNS